MATVEEKVAVEEWVAGLKGKKGIERMMSLGAVFCRGMGMKAWSEGFVLGTCRV